MTRYRSLAALVVLGAAIGVAVAALLAVRFERGDVYPAGSSLRSDPMGSRALYEALARLDGVTAERHIQALEELEAGDGTTLLLLAVSESALESAAPRLAAAARGGVRVVATLADASGSLAPRNHPVPEGPGLWGLSTQWRSLDQHPDDERLIAATVTLSQDLDLPARLDWRSPLVLTVDSPDWRVIYARDDEAVVVERNLGSGSLVVATDSYLLSNQAMLADRHPGLLAWMIGPARRVVFDEVHLGVVRPQGIMVLLRRYRLTGFFAGLSVLAALFVWRSVLPFAPTAGHAGQDSARAHPRSASAALVHLLQKGLSGPQLIAACTTAWKRSFANTTDASVSQELDRLASAEDDAAACYERMRHTLETTHHG